MKIIYFHQYYNTPESGGPLRSYHLSSCLAKAGHEVDLITAHNGKEYIKKDIEGVKVHYLPVYYDNKLGFGARIKSFIKFTFMAFLIAKKIKSDLNFASSTPLTIGITTLLLKKIKGTPYIFEIRDIWPNAPIELGILKNSLVIKIIKWLERSIYNNARSMVALSEEMAMHVEQIAPNTPVDIITNISDTEFFKPLFIQKPNKELSVTYFGAAGQANNLSTLVHTAHYFQNEQAPVTFIICAKGAQLENIKKLSGDLKLRNISFIEYMDRENLSKLLSYSDFTYLSFIDRPSLRAGSPNKLFDSLAAGIPVITNIPGWWKEELIKNKCGIYYPPDNPEVLLQQIKNFLDNPEKLISYKKNARQLAESKYSKGILCQKFLKTIN